MCKQHDSPMSPYSIHETGYTGSDLRKIPADRSYTIRCLRYLLMMSLDPPKPAVQYSPMNSACSGQ